MDVTKNKDGTVTVRIPKADEEYDPATGGLFVSETLSAGDFAKALPKAKPASKPKAKAAKKPATTAPGN